MESTAASELLASARGISIKAADTMSDTIYKTSDNSFLLLLHIRFVSDIYKNYDGDECFFVRLSNGYKVLLLNAKFDVTSYGILKSGCIQETFITSTTEREKLLKALANLWQWRHYERQRRNTSEVRKSPDNLAALS